jgi:hypothetical protein
MMAQDVRVLRDLYKGLARKDSGYSKEIRNCFSLFVNNLNGILRDERKRKKK